MHAGRILATGAPADAGRGARRGDASTRPSSATSRTAAGERGRGRRRRCRARRASAGTRRPRAPGAPPALLAIARRESLELLRDRVRLGFALFGTLLLMLVFGYGITMDVEGLCFAALDRDGTPESRAYVQEFAGSRYFVERPPIADGAALERRMRAASSAWPSRSRPASAAT